MKDYDPPAPLEKPTFATGTVSILIVTIDTPSDFTDTLRTCIASNPKEIIVVTIPRDLPRVESLASPVINDSNSVPITILTVPKPGRRTQMALAVQEASGDILCFVDDDTVWPTTQVLPYLLAGFENPNVGGVVGRQRHVDPTEPIFIDSLITFVEVLGSRRNVATRMPLLRGKLQAFTSFPATMKSRCSSTPVVVASGA
jgi:cellulose synthase/poly-beta-1,6-N-acetylglucosamine synthase-like glycosyltransferase